MFREAMVHSNRFVPKKKSLIVMDVLEDFVIQSISAARWHYLTGNNYSAYTFTDLFCKTRIAFSFFLPWTGTVSNNFKTI